MKKSRLVMVGLVLVGLSTLNSCKNEPWGDKTRIVFWTPPFPEQETRDWLVKYTDKYNEINTDNVYIDLLFIAQDAWEQTLKTSQATGDAPQLSFENYADILRKTMSGLYMPLDDYLPENAFADLYENVNEMTMENNQHYIYPAFTEPYSMLFYRKSMLNAAGVTPPTSWEEMYQASKVLTTKDRYGIQLIPSAQLGWAIWGFQAQAGHYLLNDNWDAPLVNDSFNHSLFDVWYRINKEEYTTKVAQESYTMITPLATGKVAMQLAGSWVIGQLKNDYPNVLDDIGYVPCPTIDGIVDGVTTSAMGGWGMAMDAHAENPVEAGHFINYLLAGDTNIMLEFFKSTGYSKLSGRVSVDEYMKTAPESANDPFRKFMVEKIAPYSLAEPIYIWEISRDYAQAMESTYLSNISIDNALKALDKKIKDYILANELAGTNPQK
ncbi:MAG: extracellular solute-binding protein [Bacillales bacterium]|jgi:multiple sugar transport system substrate-binding protein|nr:extracellular solute-binding protein [Bacillales bacterium]